MGIYFYIPKTDPYFALQILTVVQSRVLIPSTIRTFHLSASSHVQNTNDYRANREKFPEDDLSTRYKEGDGPSALDKASQSLLLTELVRGMWVVLESFFRPPYTLMYPFEKGALSPRFRGEHALRRYPSGMGTMFLPFVPSTLDVEKEYRDLLGGSQEPGHGLVLGTKRNSHTDSRTWGPLADEITTYTQYSDDQ